MIVLQDVCLQLRAGQALLLRGPNGAGKTTLLRTIGDLQKPITGTIDAPEDSIAYAAHQDGLKATLTVRENLQFWARIYRRHMGDVLQRMNLQVLADRPAQSLSAGQKRRLGLARLLVTGRPIWLLDEPTVSLDAASVALFGDVLRGHLADGGMALIATHIDLGIKADVLDISPFRAQHSVPQAGFEEAFL